jgi:hypothetical protein
MLNAKRFDGKIYDYREVVSNSIKSLTVQTLKDLNPCVMTGWDNTPRKGSKGNVFHFFDYYHYGAWLLVNKLKLKLSHKRHQIIFINAWNEWCEGTYLEPDRASGLLALQTTYESIYREESIPVLLTALRVVSPYYESIRLHLLEMLVSSVHSYVSLFNELYLSSTPHSHRFIAESTGLATYYFESEKLIVYTENVSASIGRPICELQGWIASSIGTPRKAAVKIGTTHDYCKREVELEITLGPKRSDVASYHRDKGIDFKDCINWKLGLDRVHVSNTEIVQAVILIGQNGQDLARLNTHLTVHQESDLEVQALGLAASHLDILNDLCSFWQYAMKLPWQEMNPKFRADLLNSYESAMNSYISLQKQIK